MNSEAFIKQTKQMPRDWRKPGLQRGDRKGKREMSEKQIKRGNVVQRFADGSFIIKGYSDRFAVIHPAKETKWFDTLPEAVQWVNGGDK
jgi:hypothetical protein